MRAVLVSLAILAGGCPGHGYPSEPRGGAGGGTLIAGQGPQYCSIYPNNIPSWDAPLSLPASCPYEGWVRQVVRDIHEVDACGPGSELRILLGIDRQGALVSVDLQAPASEESRRCVNQALRAWQFAAASAGGSLLVVYRPSA